MPVSAAPIKTEPRARKVAFFAMKRDSVVLAGKISPWKSK